MPLNLSISLIIPILNEQDSLPKLLGAVSAQSFRPNEIIFVDAGSTDNSKEIIERWTSTEQWVADRCRIISIPGAMPGAGRNAGVAVAKNDWIAFIDGGIVPTKTWLEDLSDYASKKTTQSVFGVCHFSANSSFQKSVCALSYGHGSIHPVLPASLFSKEVFKTIGYFDERLRAGEDILWQTAHKNEYGNHEVCRTARVEYSHFPDTLGQVFRKWRVTEFYCVLGGVRAKSQLIHLAGGIVLIWTLLGASLPVAGSILFIYFAVRGIINPIVRSVDIPWYGESRSAILLSPIIAVSMDIGKWIGILQGFACKLNRSVVLREKQKC